MIRSVANEIRTIAKTAVSAFTHDYTQPLAGNVDADGLPIVMIHGSSGNQLEWAGAWDNICATFPNNPCWAFSLDVSFDATTGTQQTDRGYFGLKRLAYQLDMSIEDYARELETRVDFVRERHGGKKVLLFGHSMGGLVACAYRGQEHVAAIITFCSPLQGTPHLENWLIRKVLTTRRHHEMTPGSPFLARIQERMKNSKTLFSIGSVNDWQVPADYSRLNGGARSLFVSQSGHLSITNDVTALGAAKAFIDALA